jgi:hypothetical protein
LSKAEQAARVLRDEFFMEELDAMKAECVLQIVNSRPDDYDQREEAYRSIRTINQIIARFESIAAQKEIDAKRWKIL